MIQTTTIKLDADLKNRMKQLAETYHRSVHWLMLEAIRQYLEREEKREYLREEAMKAWNHYQQTGLHLTQKEADAWLAQLEEDKEEDFPPCHG
jgi:predicted transcriptional regulator